MIYYTNLLVWEGCQKYEGFFFADKLSVDVSLAAPETIDDGCIFVNGDLLDDKFSVMNWKACLKILFLQTYK